MKKITAIVILLLFCLSFSSCGSSGSAPSASEVSGQLSSFDTTMNVKYRSIAATATMHRDSGVCEIAFTSPQALSGMRVTCAGDTMTLSYMGISTTMTRDNFPGNAVVRTVLNSIDAITKESGVRITADKSSLVISGTNDDGTGFALTLDPQNQNLMKLSVPAQELEIEFINFTFLN